MDRQLAERMVGAAVLLAVLVLVVPALLDGGGGGEPPDVLPQPVLPVEPRRTIRIDDQGRTPPVPRAAAPIPIEPPAETRVDPEADPLVPAGAQPGAPAAVPAGVTPGAESPGPPAEAATGPGVPVTETIPAARLAVPDRPVESAAAAAPTVTPVAPGPVPAPMSPPKAATAAKALAPLPAGDWVVQLGSFANPANAERLASQVRGRGYTATITETGSGSGRMYRVRAGSATTREAADRLARDLAASGFPGTVARP